MVLLLVLLLLAAPIEADEHLLPARDMLAALLGHGDRYSEIAERTGVRLTIGPEPPEGGLHVDHVTPVVAGGSNEPANLWAACSVCNLG